MKTPDLLRKAADALDDGIDPFSRAFLAEHGVTLDEAQLLGSMLARGARLIARAVEDPRTEEGIAFALTLAREAQ